MKVIFETQGNGLDVFLSFQNKKTENALSIYIFGPGLFDEILKDLSGSDQDHPLLHQLHNVLKQHIGHKQHDAFLTHLGSRNLLDPIGSVERHGSLADQEERLQKFISDLPHLSGGFGPWWPETWDNITSHTGEYRAFPWNIVLFQDVPGRKPFGWDETGFVTWGSSWTKRGMECGLSIITSLKADNVFTQYPAVKLQTLGEWCSSQLSILQETTDAPQSGSKNITVRFKVKPGHDKEPEMMDGWNGAKTDELITLIGKADPSKHENPVRISHLPDTCADDIVNDPILRVQ